MSDIDEKALAQEVKAALDKSEKSNAELQSKVKELEESNKTYAEKQAEMEKQIAENAETTKELDEAVKAAKAAAVRAETKENLEGVTEKGLRNFNAGRREKGLPRLELADAISYSKAFNAATTAGAEKEYQKSLLDDKAKEYFVMIEKDLTGGATDGGVLIAPAFASNVEQTIRDMNDFMAHARTIRVSAQPGGNTVQRVLNGRAAVAWNDVSSITAATGNNSPASIKSDVRVRQLISVQEVTMDLLESAEFSLAEYLTEPVAMDMSLEVEESMISTGTGNAGNNPEALINATNITDGALPAFAQSGYFGHFRGVDGGHASDLVETSTVSVTSILGQMPAELKTGYRRNGRWFMNPTTLAKIRTLKATDGHFIVRDQSEGVGNALAPMLFGYPISICESFPDVAANALPIAFGDMYRAYTIAQGRGMQMRVDNTSQFPTTRYLFSQRIGGAPFDPLAMRFLIVSA